MRVSAPASRSVPSSSSYLLRLACLKYASAIATSYVTSTHFHAEQTIETDTSLDDDHEISATRSSTNCSLRPPAAVTTKQLESNERCHTKPSNKKKDPRSRPASATADYVLKQGRSRSFLPDPCWAAALPPTWRGPGWTGLSSWYGLSIPVQLRSPCRARGVMEGRGQVERAAGAHVD